MVENLFLQKNPLQDLFSSLNAVISTNENTEFLSDHVIYNRAYTYKLQLKTTKVLGNYSKWGEKVSCSLELFFVVKSIELDVSNLAIGVKYF